MLNKTICKHVQELKSKLLLGLIREEFFQRELDHLATLTEDEEMQTYIQKAKDRGI